MQCNLSPRKFNTLLCKPIPQIWHDIFKAWFSFHHIPIECTQQSRRSDLLNSLLCFCEPVSKTIKKFGGEYDEVTVYEILAEHHVLTWADFLINFDNMLALKPVYTDLPMLLIHIKISIPPSWKEIFGIVDISTHLKRLHTVDCCLQG